MMVKNTKLKQYMYIQENTYYIILAYSFLFFYSWLQVIFI